jgi:hypothetical protein
MAWHGASVPAMSHLLCFFIATTIASGDCMNCREPGTAESLLSLDGQVLRERDVLLHHPGQWPCGTIGPVHALLLPPQHVNEAALLPPAGGQASPVAPVRLWLWLHPAAYHEGLAALQRLCQPLDAAQQQQPDVTAPAGVTITPMSRHLRRLELRGPSSTRLLADLLPAARALASPPAPAGMVQSENPASLEHAACATHISSDHALVLSATSAGTVLACQVQDPRLASCEGDADLDAALSGEASDGDAVMAEAAEVPPATDGSADMGRQHAASTAPHLWEGPDAVRPPHSESQVLQPNSTCTCLSTVYPTV